MSERNPMTDVLTAADAERRLRADFERLEGVRRALEAAEREFAYRSQRALYLTDEEHRAALTRHVRPLEAAESETEAVADAAWRDARRILDHVEAATESVLSPGDLATAAAQREFVKEDCERLPLPRLVERVRAAVVRDDKPVMFLYRRYADARLKANAQGERGQAEGAELDALLRQIGAMLADRSLDPLRAKLHRQLADASQLKSHATKRRLAEQVRNATTADGRKKIPWPQEVR